MNLPVVFARSLTLADLRVARWLLARRFTSPASTMSFRSVQRANTEKVVPSTEALIASVPGSSITT